MTRTILLLTLVLSAAAAQSRIAVRQDIQQARIAQGARSGSLTPRETVRLERQEAALNAQIRRDRVDGGGLTPAERLRIEREQDRLSREIVRQKADAQRR